MKQSIDIHDYYFGVIVATPEYLKSTQRVRLLEGINYDPFSELTDNEAMIFSTVTLLKKEKINGSDFYIDQYNSRYQNELKYQLNTPNRLGIVLAYIKPFTEYYTESPTWYLEEDIVNNNLLSQIYEEHTYYISHSKLQNSEAIVTLENYEQAIKEDYLIHLLGEDMYSQMITKYKEHIKDIDEF